MLLTRSINESEEMIVKFTGNVNSFEVPVSKTQNKVITTIASSSINSSSPKVITFAPDSRITKILDCAFQFNQIIESIKLPDSLIELCGGAFLECSNLKEVILNEGLQKIGTLAFSKCSIRKIEFPKSLISLNITCFAKCTKLKEVIFHPDSKIKRLPEECFEQCVELDTLKIPDSVDYIGFKCFMECNFKEIIVAKQIEGPAVEGILYIPPSVKIINNSAFSQIPVQKITYSDVQGISEIKNGTFEGCEENQEVTLSSSIKYIGPDAFNENFALKTVNIPDHSKLNHIVKAFYLCRELESIKFPASLENLGDFALSYCEKLSSVEFSSGSKLKRIGKGAFSFCTSLEFIEFPDTLEILCNQAFFHCKNLTASFFDDNCKITEIPKECFAFCENIREFRVPPSVETIRSLAFAVCSELSSIVFPGNSQLSIIEDHAFSSTKLTSFKLPKTFKYGDISAHNGFGWKSINISPGGRYYANDSSGTFIKLHPMEVICVSKIKNHATIRELTRIIGKSSFQYQVALTRIYFPASIKVIDQAAFLFCTSLQRADFNKDCKLDSIEGDAFRCCNNLEMIHLPPVKIIKSSAFAMCEKIRSIKLTDTQSIQDGAFFGCSNAENVVVPSSIVEVWSDAFDSKSRIEFLPYSDCQWLDISSVHDIKCPKSWESSIKTIKSRIIIETFDDDQSFIPVFTDICSISMKAEKMIGNKKVINWDKEISLEEAEEIKKHAYIDPEMRELMMENIRIAEKIS